MTVCTYGGGGQSTARLKCYGDCLYMPKKGWGGGQSTSRLTCFGECLYMPRGAINSAFDVLGKEKDGWRQWQSSWGIVRPLVNEQVKKLVIFHTQVVCPAVSYCKTFAY